jgi:hypothetical protein
LEDLPRAMTSAEVLGELLRGGGAGSGEDAQLEDAVADAHRTQQPTQVLALLEANPGSALCFASPTVAMLACLRAAVVDAHASVVITLGCGRGLLEWLLACELEPAGVDVRTFELDGVQVDFVPEEWVTRVRSGAEPPAMPQDAVLLCAWGETGMFPPYLSAYPGRCVITIGEESGLFTDPEPRCDLGDGWAMASAHEFGSDSVTIYHRTSGGAPSGPL